jgi:hypothetical protein
MREVSWASDEISKVRKQMAWQFMLAVKNVFVLCAATLITVFFITHWSALSNTMNALDQTSINLSKRQPVFWSLADDYLKQGREIEQRRVLPDMLTNANDLVEKFSKHLNVSSVTSDFTTIVNVVKEFMESFMEQKKMVIELPLGKKNS